MHVRRSRTPAAVFFAVLALAALAFTASGREARADVLSSCGNIDIQAQANCTLQTSGGCTAMCTPLAVQASCVAQLETSCTGGCSATADVSCTGNCTGSCNSNCNVNPGSFDCQGSCEADCSGNCEGECMTANDKSQCSASCKASCTGHCNGQCSGTPPMATCTAKCQASCQGSCSGQANLACDIDCQTQGYASCQASVQGGCNVQCTQPKGALFCDGQYISTSNVDQCVSDLESLLHITVTAEASGSCAGNTCMGEASASASCDMAPGPNGVSAGWLLAGVVAIGGGVSRRMRARKTARSAGSSTR